MSLEGDHREEARDRKTWRILFMGASSRCWPGSRDFKWGKSLSRRHPRNQLVADVEAKQHEDLGLLPALVDHVARMGL